MSPERPDGLTEEPGLRRHSSRLERLDRDYLSRRLTGATAYRRIAGYFRSSILELVGEQIADIPDVRIVCNSELDGRDLLVARAAREQALLQRWNGTVEGQAVSGLEVLLQRERFRQLHALLVRGNVQVRVVPRDRLFLHGKAGIIERPEGRTCFLGSINETRSAFADHYEILWEDPSPEGVAWVDREFDALWELGIPLPDALITEIGRLARRSEVALDTLVAPDVPGAALVESPLYRAGEQLQPWQRAFVSLGLEHRERHGKIRLLLADEVGLGKTLSLATAALVTALLDDGPVLIVCPSTLTLQWQVELQDRLGIPSAVWHTQKKAWVDPDGHMIRTRGPEDVARCPFQIAIVSNGLLVHQSEEARHLLGRRYGSVILDEAHKARSKPARSGPEREPNNLLRFMRDVGPRTRHLLLGTATPIQTDVSDLWDLLSILDSGADHVLGKLGSAWRSAERVVPFLKGAESPLDEREAWELLRNPLPPAEEGPTFASLRLHLDLEAAVIHSDRAYPDLPVPVKMMLSSMLDPSAFQGCNPILRHTVLRRRDTLEQMGLLERIRVDVHPDPDAATGRYGEVVFTGLGLDTNHPFRLAYEAALSFTGLFASRTGLGIGFLRSMILQRICSSFAAGRATARKLIAREDLEEDEEGRIGRELRELSPDEQRQLRTLLEELERPEARDPKLAAVLGFLSGVTSEGRTWLEHGCIVFSQYYDTARWLAEQLALALPDEPIGLYAGAGKSGLLRGQTFASADRNALKAAVRNHDIRLMIATDAACEGLNLQTLGTLINVDLPWNPSRLEQRLGRIKRFGQVRQSVDMLNLVYHDTRDEDVYRALSRRMRDRYDIFGGLPDTILDDWIENEQQLNLELDKYLDRRREARDVFELRYRGTLDPEQNRWERCERVLARSDVLERLGRPWG
jgi:superfamily II DNA or RNA helicase